MELRIFESFMKQLLLPIIIFVSAGHIALGQPDYGRTNVIYQDTYNAAVQDLKSSLAPYRAGTITLEKVALERRTGQEFYLAINASKTEIKYTTQNSLENAIYTYLDMLGFRWYGPGDNWFIKPKTLSRENFTGKWLQPTFRNRSFFGTGGLNFGKMQPFDPQNDYKTKWLAWKRRNRFNADFNTAGHRGESFYLNNKALLDKNPDWFTNAKGKRNGRIKIDNPDAVNAYKAWIQKDYNTLQKGNDAFIVLGVDPADGRGGADDPLPKSMPGIKNYADKWWWLANEVAGDYQKDPRVVVSMYAYGNGPDNARVPDFKLKNNIYPVIIPYAFQSAYLPKEMVKKWADAITGQMGLYDYWNITQWSQGVPQFDIYTMAAKLKFWQRHKVNGIYLETTDAAGPMGHSLWLAGQMEWDLNKDFNTLYSQYLRDCFEKAAPFIKDMFDRWSKNYQDAADVAFSLQNLKNASDAVKKNSPEWKRITELKAYVHYLKMYYEHDDTQESKDAIYRYLYSIHHLMMVQTAAFISQRYITPLDKGNIVPSGQGIRQRTEKEIENQFNKDLATTPVPYRLATFTFDYDKVTYEAPIPNASWRFGGFQCRFFFVAPFSGKISLDAGAETNTPLKIFTDDSVLVDEQVGTKDFDYSEDVAGRTWKLKRFTINIQKGQTYYIQTSYGFSRVKINTPGIVLFKNPGSADFDNYQYPVQYFYVPEDVTEIAFFDAQPEGTNRRGYLVTPDGTPLKRISAGAKNVYKVVVDQKYRGKIWTADFGHPNWRFLNIPNITSLQKFGYEVKN